MKKKRLVMALQAVAEQLSPLAASVRLGQKDRRLRIRTWQTGLCWSFANGIRRWMRADGVEDGVSGVVVSDQDADVYAIHVLARSPSGLLLDSYGVWTEREAILMHATEYFGLDDVLTRVDGVRAPSHKLSWRDGKLIIDDFEEAWIDSDLSGFQLRSHGIFPPRPALVKAVAEAMEAHAGPASEAL